MLDLCLIQLPNPALESPRMYFPLGILYIAAVAENLGFSVEVVDLREGDEPLPEASYYGFSCTTPEITRAKELAKGVKGVTIVGGAHPTLLPEDCENYFDVVVIGEGEPVIADILSGKIKHPKIIHSPRIRDLDELPFPRWKKLDDPFSETLFPGERYGTGGKSATLTGSRGCPWKCAFCANIFNNPVVYRSVVDIIEEIKALKELDIHYFRFEDDNFTIHPQFDELCLEIGKLDIIYKCATRSNLVTPDKAAKMRASGCEECGLGVESADDYVLALNRKRETVAEHGEAVEILRQAGLRAKTYFMAGLPGENDETLKANMNFMRKHKPDRWTLSTFTPYPGSDTFNYPERYHITIVNPNWENWWNFVVPLKDKVLEGRAGFVHVINGQTREQMQERHDKFLEFLKGEKWKD